MKTSCCHSKKVQLEKEILVCMNQNCSNFMAPSMPYSARRWNSIFFAFFFIFLFMLSYNDYSYDNKSLDTVELRPKLIELCPLNAENLRNELDANHIICPKQVYAQIMIESGHLNSFLCKRTNNLLGMRYPIKRTTTAIGIFLPASNLIIKGTQAELKKYSNQNNYAVYENWQDCVKDYKLWQEQSFKLTELYLAFLGNCYAEDPLYVSKIKSMAK